MGRMNYHLEMLLQRPALERLYAADALLDSLSAEDVAGWAEEAADEEDAHQPSRR